MKLLLHIGTEKTGSSFLQKVCALNRPWLERSGIYFPLAGRDERRMRKGTISPGNARELAELVERDAWGHVEGWLKERIELASSRSLDCLLLSHELLFSQLARDDVMENLERSLSRVGVVQVSALLFVRDPVDHAISLYKHRGKNGNIGAVGEWVNSSYSTAMDLKSLVDVLDSGLMCFSTRKFRKRTDYLLKTFFEDWLGLGAPPLLPEGPVNPSLTLSEIEFIKQLAKTGSRDASLYYRHLLAVPLESKAEDDSLDVSARHVASNYLADFEETWKKFDKLLEKDGGLNVPVRCSSDSTSNQIFTFSSAQLQAIAKGNREAGSGCYKLTQMFDKYFRPPLGKLKRALFS